MTIIRKSILALTVAAVAWASPAAAQTGTGSLVTSPARIPGDADGVVKLDGWAKRVTPALPRKTTVYGPCAGLPDFTYRVREACPTIPPVVTEPPVVVTPTPPQPSDLFGRLQTGVNARGVRYVESAIRNSQISFGFNYAGSLGTTNNAGPGKPFATDVKNGFIRLAGKTETGDDFLLPGRAQDIAIVIANGEISASGALAGYETLRGDFLNPFTFSGQSYRYLGDNKYEPTGILYIQKVALEGTALTYSVTLTNARVTPTSVTYLRSEDPDTSADYKTQNKVVRQGRWDAGLSTGEVYFIESPDAGVYNATVTYDKAIGVGTRREIGYNVKADLTLQLIWPARVLQPGESMQISFRQGIRE